ncbi:type II toxin-antitoxin system Phd/YefM family antitoxin [Intrasporangium calvum]|uniref:type II toxin-antitoxin system Phd/YefM family antitoxin n=1 Tax=Intrasporangium calvum TaxID=53358 RepID=UPI000DF5F1D4|nr:type II toxin-antitoxin system Phd/YefM family antitoxin [Intrasporangium calvum]AXG14496.1 type II toxin-antitoxin system Phd/YefM family antitoxin [Intrasporangium calvum]
MQEIPVTEARAQLSDLVNRVAYGGQPVVLTRHGKPLVALVPVASLEPDLGARETDAEDSLTVLDLTTRQGESQANYAIAAQHTRTD